MKKRGKKNNLLLITIVSLILFLILLIDILTTKQITKIDYAIYKNIFSIQNPILTPIFITITNFGSTLPLIILTILLSIFLLLRKKYSHLILLISSMLLGLVLELSIKYLVHRLRPSYSLIQERLFSFPSGHTTMATIFFTILLYSIIENIKNKKIKVYLSAIALILIILIGFSRIYLGVHWFSDVIGGFILGILINSIALLVMKYYYKK